MHVAPNLKLNNQIGKGTKPSYLAKKEPTSRRSPEMHLEMKEQLLVDFQPEADLILPYQFSNHNFSLCPINKLAVLGFVSLWDRYCLKAFSL